ncbi:MAG: ribosome recycling factor [Planctomycetales bacterium]|nr:ribosome recycling factor [bacterium]UNM09870.1 MAG: ribosome recycling factor [Planctomycetales bacterium]
MSHPTTPQEIIVDADHRMAQSLESIKQELVHLRAGRASTSLVDHIKVHAYDSDMPMSQLATISTPDATTIMITAYDKGNLAAIEKAIQQSELGLTPQNDGSIIRLTIPPLTEDRRKDLVKAVGKYAEDGRVSMRNVRRDANDHLKKLNKNKELSDDEFHIYLEKVDKKLEVHLEDLEKVIKDKQNEVMEI